MWNKIIKFIDARVLNCRYLFLQLLYVFMLMISTVSKNKAKRIEHLSFWMKINIFVFNIYIQFVYFASICSLKLNNNATFHFRGYLKKYEHQSNVLKKIINKMNR